MKVHDGEEGANDEDDDDEDDCEEDLEELDGESNGEADPDHDDDDVIRSNDDADMKSGAAAVADITTDDHNENHHKQSRAKLTSLKSKANSKVKRKQPARKRTVNKDISIKLEMVDGHADKANNRQPNKRLNNNRKQVDIKLALNEANNNVAFANQQYSPSNEDLKQPSSPNHKLGDTNNRLLKREQQQAQYHNEHLHNNSYHSDTSTSFPTPQYNLASQQQLPAELLVIGSRQAAPTTTPNATKASCRINSSASSSSSTSSSTSSTVNNHKSPLDGMQNRITSPGVAPATTTTTSTDTSNTSPANLSEW